MEGGDVNSVEGDVRFVVESLVLALCEVDDVNGEVLVVPVASPLAADLFAGCLVVLTGSPSDRLVVSEE